MIIYSFLKGRGKVERPSRVGRAVSEAATPSPRASRQHPRQAGESLQGRSGRLHRPGPKQLHVRPGSRLPARRRQRDRAQDPRDILHPRHRYHPSLLGTKYDYLITFVGLCASELKHGPLALVQGDMPVILFIMQDRFKDVRSHFKQRRLGIRNLV